MKPLDQMPDAVLRDAQVLLTDLDDTLTESGHLPSSSLDALEKISESGLKVAVVTGRSGGWCDHIARQWSCDAVIGETGAFAFYRDPLTDRRVEMFVDTDEVRARNRLALDQLGEVILREITGATLASDQPYRLCDLAIDLGEDVPALDREIVDRVLARCRDSGATAVASACHVNAWFGEYDKFSMAQRVLAEVFELHPEEDNEKILCIGDSANDLPMFQGFRNSVGVANVHDLDSDIRPAWVTTARSATGFLEFADRIVAARPESSGSRP